METIHEDLITTDPVPFLSIEGGVQVFVLRTDKIHAVVSGNKWYKLRYYLEEAQRQQKKTIVTYGGAYSNHIVAMAAACRMYGFKSVGIIRGEEPQQYAHTLLAARQYGMQLHFLTRAAYQVKTIPTSLINPANYFINEGGYGHQGAAGAATITYDKEKFDAVCCAVGTGTMLAGLINGSHPSTEITGFSVLKNNRSLEKNVASLLLNSNRKVTICHDYHFGGYAKANALLLHFMNELYTHTGIPTDFVYTAKLFYGVQSLINNGYFKNCKNLLIIHSGGLQGNASLPKETLLF